jgi:phosphoenolpyruvate---glycerone phosphotransferase subunit DhaK
LKRILNDVDKAVEEELEGLVLLFPDLLRRIEGTNVIVRRDSPVAGKVALVCGGGSGHEPMHGGFVGKGLLDAAVAGEIFSAPPPDQIYRAITEVNGGKGVLLVINNFAGEVMNFKIAEEMAHDDGIPIAHVINNDDVAIPDLEKRRGIAGTILVEKIAGAIAEEGAELDEVKRVSEKVASNTRSMGVALSSCTLPRLGKPTFHLEEDEIELGIGVHGEGGIQRSKIKPANQIAEFLFNHVADDLKLARGDEVIAVVNGMGATSLMELLVFSRRVIQMVKSRSAFVFKSAVGNFVTSLDMAGASLTLLRVDDEIKRLAVAPDSAPLFPKMV